MKTFNTAGPVRPDEHYTVPALACWDMEEIRRLIGEKRYFVLHAPRQTGKTSCLLALMAQLNTESDYTVLYVNLEPAQAVHGDVAAGMRTIVSGIAEGARRYLGDQRPQESVEGVLHVFGPHGALRGLLSRWSEENDRPIVLLLDEVDSLVADTLISLLRQIRAGYPDRPRAFPQTVLLYGVRGAGCGMCGITVSTTAITKSLPAVAPSISNPNPCAWGTSAMGMSLSSMPNIPKRAGRHSKTD